MRFPRFLWPLALLVGALALGAAEPHPSLPPPVIPDCLGVNIHFTDPKPGEMEMLAAAGFKWVRMDLTWASTERKKGEYDFSAYDRLVAKLDEFKLRAVFILDYGNPLYADPGDKQPFTSRAGTPEFREAFAHWAVAAVSHFKGRGYLWEMWNEPNGGFWKPKADVDQYVALTRATGEALRAAHLLGPKGEAFIGPATSTIDLPFLEACFKAGMLEFWDGVSVHPYRQNHPETVINEYRSLRDLIHQYAPKDKVIPVISGEWGYSSAWATQGKDEAECRDQQGKYLPRQFLTNIANDVAVSIWYDWHEDGPDPKEAEHRFGIVGHEYHPGRDPVYDPKPAYIAMKTLTEELRGLRFNKEIEEYGRTLLLFGTEEKAKWVAWSHSSTERDFLPLALDRSLFDRKNYLGVAPLFRPLEIDQFLLDRKTYLGVAPLFVAKAPLPFKFEEGRIAPGTEASVAPRKTTVTPPALTVPVHPDGPNYFALKEPHFLTAAIAALPRLPLEYYIHAPASIEVPFRFVNPTNEGHWFRAYGDAHLHFPVFMGVFCYVPALFRDEELIAPNTDRTTPRSFAFPARTNTWFFRMEFIYGGSASKKVDDRNGFVKGSQRARIVVENRLETEFVPLAKNKIRATVKNPSGEPFRGSIEFLNKAIPLDFTQGEKSWSKDIELFTAASRAMLAGIFTDDMVPDPNPSKGQPTRWASFAFEPDFVDGSLFKSSKIIASGDAAVSSFAEKKVVPAPKSDYGPAGEVIRLRYRADAGRKFFQLIPTSTKELELPPISNGTEYGLWVFGDAQGCEVRLRMKDENGKTFQFSGPKIDWKGWRFVRIPVGDSAISTHWGGDKTNEREWPMKWDTLFLLDNPSRQPVEGEIFLGLPCIIN